MKPTADFVEDERALVSELAALSRDPALTFRPDPAFRAKFRNADEIVEDGLERIDASARPVFTAAPKTSHARAPDYPETARRAIREMHRRGATGCRSEWSCSARVDPTSPGDAGLDRRHARDPAVGVPRTRPRTVMST